MPYITVKELEKQFKQMFKISKSYLKNAHGSTGKSRLYLLVRAYGYATEAEVALDLLGLDEEREKWAEDLTLLIYDIDEELGV